MIKIDPETMGAWIVYNGRKLTLDVNGASEFPVLDETAKSTDLLSRLSATNEANLSQGEVDAIAKAARLNPRLELPVLLRSLEERRLISQTSTGIRVIGVTTRGTLKHAHDMFQDANPSSEERASISLAEASSQSPILKKEMIEIIGDQHQLPVGRATDFVNRAESIGFVDAEGEGADRLLFNGNIFRRDHVKKTDKVLSALSSGEQRKVNEFAEILQNRQCIIATEAEKILGSALFEKLKAAGVYDMNTVANDAGEHVYITSPGAFHKFTNPLLDDCFDMAKALTAALTYGMTKRSQSEGRIWGVSLLLKKLIRGEEVGPATAIGADYRVLEQNRVVQIIPDNRGFRMRLLKTEVGEIALRVLATGNTNANAIEGILPTASMTSFRGPEESRMTVRRNQTSKSKAATQDIVNALRGGRV